jgi:hypothetical protein
VLVSWDMFSLCQTPIKLDFLFVWELNYLCCGSPLDTLMDLSILTWLKHSKPMHSMPLVMVLDQVIEPFGTCNGSLLVFLGWSTSPCMYATTLVSLTKVTSFFDCPLIRALYKWAIREKS